MLFQGKRDAECGLALGLDLQRRGGYECLAGKQGAVDGRCIADYGSVTGEAPRCVVWESVVGCEFREGVFVGGELAETYPFWVGMPPDRDFFLQISLSRRSEYEDSAIDLY